MYGVDLRILGALAETQAIQRGGTAGMNFFGMNTLVGSGEPILIPAFLDDYGFQDLQDGLRG